MNKYIRRLALVTLSILLFPDVSFARMPREIAGFVLGDSVDKYYDRLKMDTAQPIRYQEYLKEVKSRIPRALKAAWHGTVPAPPRAESSGSS